MSLRLAVCVAVFAHDCMGMPMVTGPRALQEGCQTEESIGLRYCTDLVDAFFRGAGASGGRGVTGVDSDQFLGGGLVAV